MSKEMIENLLYKIFNLDQVIWIKRVDKDLFFIGQSAKQIFEFKFKERNK